MGDTVKLPPGFVFSPSDEELILHFLYSKASHLIPSHSNFIPHLDLSLLLPWELNGILLYYYYYTIIHVTKYIFKQVRLCVVEMMMTNTISSPN